MQKSQHFMPSFQYSPRHSLSPLVQMGFVLPVLPPRALLADSLFPLEDYFNKVLELEKVRWLRHASFTSILVS